MLQNGVDPYFAGPGTLPGSFADQVSWVWRYTPAPYGPLSLQLQRGIVLLCGQDPYWSAVAMRSLALVGVALIGIFIPRIASRLGVNAQLAAWFSVLNPFLIIDFVGGAHNDSLMMGLTVFGIWLALVGGWWWLLGAAVIGVGAAIKQPALMAGYAAGMLGVGWHGWRLKPLLKSAGGAIGGVAIAVASFALVSVATGLNFGWYNAVGVPGSVPSLAPSTMSGYAIGGTLDWLGYHAAAAATVTTSQGIWLAASAIVVAILAATIGRTRPVAFLAWAYLVVAVGGPALHSWYLLWGGLFLPMSEPSARVSRIAHWTVVGVLFYAA
ncbi:MAG: hypothetical protein CR980_01915, partial [Propionibacteriales bacterium]